MKTGIEIHLLHIRIHLRAKGGVAQERVSLPTTQVNVLSKRSLEI